MYQGYGGAEEHKGEYANVIAQFTDNIANSQSPKLYDDGTQIQYFTHIDDVVRAIMLAADRRLNGIFNIGTGRQRSFNTVVDMINDILNTDIEPKYVENPISKDVYVRDTCADASRIR
jgi:UDP-glucose 4-epimerase